MTAEDIATAVRVLKPSPGNILVIDYPAGMDISYLTEVVEALKLDGATVLLLPSTYRIACVDPTVTIKELAKEFFR